MTSHTAPITRSPPADKMKRTLLVLLVSMVTLSADIVETTITHAEAKFRVVRLAPARVQLVWKDQNGDPYRSFDKVQTAFTHQGKTVKFLMNAGIFEPGGIPSGLHIEEGKSLRPLNLADAPGNFFLKPNGVCAVGKAGRDAFIGSCDAWRKRAETPVAESWAIQSGPLLLIDGKHHPAFRNGSASKLHRNGVGIDGKGNLVFAITDKRQEVNFWDFAGLFLRLGCQDALFLDGDISQMAVNPDKPVPSNFFGAVFVVAE